MLILIACQVVVPDLSTLGALGIDPFALELECAEAAEERQELKESCANDVIERSDVASN